MRNALKKQVSDLALAVARHFPPGTRISAPKGGMCLWVELDRRLDALQLFERALQEHISILPGALCSTTDSYNHCIRLNCGYPLTDDSERGVAVVGRLVRDLAGD